MRGRNTAPTRSAARLTPTLSPCSTGRAEHCPSSRSTRRRPPPRRATAHALRAPAALERSRAGPARPCPLPGAGPPLAPVTPNSASCRLLAPLPTAHCPSSEGTHHGPRPHQRPRRRARHARRGQGAPARRRHRRGHADRQPHRHLAPARRGGPGPGAHHAELVLLPRCLAAGPAARAAAAPGAEHRLPSALCRRRVVATVSRRHLSARRRRRRPRASSAGARSPGPSRAASPTASRSPSPPATAMPPPTCPRRSARRSCCSSPTGTSTASRWRSALPAPPLPAWCPSCSQPYRSVRL